MNRDKSISSDSILVLLLKHYKYIIIYTYMCVWTWVWGNIHITHALKKWVAKSKYDQKQLWLSKGSCNGSPFMLTKKMVTVATVNTFVGTIASKINVTNIGVRLSKLDVDPQRDDDASPMSTYRCMLRPTWMISALQHKSKYKSNSISNFF